MRILSIVFSFSLLFTSLVHADENPETGDLWTLSFQDDFERTELGSDWTSNDAVIREGRMLVGSNRPACAKITKAFPSDVKIEFDAEAFEGAGERRGEGCLFDGGGREGEVSGGEYWFRISDVSFSAVLEYRRERLACGPKFGAECEQGRCGGALGAIRIGRACDAQVG